MLLSQRGTQPPLLNPSTPKSMGSDAMGETASFTCKLSTCRMLYGGACCTLQYHVQGPET